MGAVNLELQRHFKRNPHSKTLWYSPQLRSTPGSSCSPLVGVVGLDLRLQRQDLLVALGEALRESDHDVALLQQQLLVALHLRTGEAAAGGGSSMVEAQSAAKQAGGQTCCMPWWTALANRLRTEPELGSPQRWHAAKPLPPHLRLVLLHRLPLLLEVPQPVLVLLPDARLLLGQQRPARQWEGAETTRVRRKELRVHVWVCWELHMLNVLQG